MQNVLNMFLRGAGVVLLLGGLLSPVAAGNLPERLELEYTLSHGKLSIGEVTRKLYRKPGNRYTHTMWTRATGMARLLTQAEWREEGEFSVEGNDVRPLRFSETRSGDKKAYNHRVSFDWTNARITFHGASPQTLPRGTQDQSSVIYALMLNPLTQPGERRIMATNGKDLDTYLFQYHGRETLETAIGKLETIVIRRISPKQIEEERRCRAENRKPADCPPDDFTYWLAPSKQFIAVKMQKRRNDDISTMILRELRGL